MRVLLKTDRAGFKMTGLELKKGGLFIGLSRNSSVPVPRATISPRWRRKEGQWRKTGLNGPSNTWFLGIAVAEAGKSMTPPVEPKGPLYRENESPFEIYRRTKILSNRR